MGAELEAPKWNLHPIKLRFVHLHTLKFEAGFLPESATKEEMQRAFTPQWLFSVTGNVDKENAVVVASLKCRFNMAPAPAQKSGAQEAEADDRHSSPPEPYRLEVAAVAGFTFNPNEIPAPEVKLWCDKGSFFVLAPYLRNVIAGITRESGFPEVLLPLLEVPTFRPPSAKPQSGQAQESPEL
jgi:hypothetical protein